MKIELKNVKHSKFASQETNCFEATIYIDGKKQGTADNNGHGGSTSVHPNALYVALSAYAETLQPTVYEDKQFLLGAGDVIDDLLADWLYSRDLKRAMQKRILSMRDGNLGALK
jgi:hypothetical protein